MMFQRGGQRRTIEAGCGWRCVGHPQEVNGKFKIHKKFCNDCKESLTEELPEFNKEGGKMNGWKGLTNRGERPNQMLTSALIEGEQFNIYTKANSMKEAMDETILTANLLAGGFEAVGAEPPLSKSQKKRQKQKAKKQKEDEKKELLARYCYEKLPAEVLDKFLDENEDKEDDEGALAELMGQYCSTLELEAIIHMLGK